MISSVARIAQNAGSILMEHLSRELAVSTKSDAFDFVTSADLESDGFIRQRLKEEFPNDRILSEENSHVPAEFGGRVWMVDPLDGTKDYVNGGDGFSVMIGLCEDGVPVLGVVFAPKRNLLLYAAKGQGAYVQTGGEKRALAVSNTSKLEDSRMVVRIKYGEGRDLDKMIEKLRIKGIPEASVGLKVGLIAEGAAEFNVNTNFRASKWDTCAPQIILEEAGGKMTDFDGLPLDYTQSSSKWMRSYVASNSAIHEKVIGFIKKNS